MKRLVPLCFALLTATSLHAQTAPVPAGLHAELGATTKPQQANLLQRDFAPGETTGPHLHHGIEQTYIVSGSMEIKIAGQPTHIYHAGESFQIPRDTPHQGTNIGTTKATLIASYVVDSDSPIRIPLPNLDTPAPAAQSTRTPQFENDAVNVWRTTILPDAPLTFHRHDHPRIIVALEGGQMKFVEQTGHVDNQIWETGKAYLLPAMPPGVMHEDVDAGTKPLDVMVIELKHEK